jgi:hypothetical protein
MSYKRIRVWDGTTWQQVGAQVPQVLEAYGSETESLVSGAATITVTFAEGTFGEAPLVFTQLTGANSAVIRVTSVTDEGFSAAITGTGTDEISFSWFAVQPE